MIISSTDSLEFSRVGTTGIKTVLIAPFDCILYARFTSAIPLGGELWRQTTFGAEITNIALGNNLEHNNIFLFQGDQISEAFMAGVSYQLFLMRVD